MESTTLASPSAADVRAALAHKRARLYLIAAAVGVHPVRLGQIFTAERGTDFEEPLPPGTRVYWLTDDVGPVVIGSVAAVDQALEAAVAYRDARGEQWLRAQLGELEPGA